jgi:3-deoxy-manno-octulosonate cytidylyltransferase (CMP-KDO synthetase)
MKIVGVIPSRYGSTRLEGKPLKDILGKPMIQYVYELVNKASLIDDVIVATDDYRIKSAVEKFGGIAQMTSKDHKSGTDRIAEVARNIEADIVVNIQGDEPLLDPRMIDEAIEPLLTDPNLLTSTLCKKIKDEMDIQNPNVVKTVFSKDGNALYFSRSLIPYPRNQNITDVYEHIGIYVYRYAFLMRYIQMPQSPLELTESLEQLRILENDIKLKVVVTAYESDGPSVDTIEDLEAVRKIISSKENRMP